MSAAETARAIVIGLKRLVRGALWLFIGLFALLIVVAGVEAAKEYIENRPYRAISYADINLSDTQEQVLYAVGPPTHFIDPTPVVIDGTPFSEFDRVVDVKNADEKVTYKDSKKWIFTGDRMSTAIGFDKPGGRVVSIACFSESPYSSCPALYGIRDGSNEDDVLSQLGEPNSQQLDGGTKTMRYPQYNLTVYLEKRRVNMLKLSENAAL